MKGSRYIIPAIAVLLLMIFSAVWLFTTGFPYLDKKSRSAADVLGQVDSEHEMLQTFTAPADSISRLEILVSKSDYRSGGTLRLRIYEMMGVEHNGVPLLGRQIHESELDLASFDYTGGQRIEFEPLRVGRNETYGLRITSDNPPSTGVAMLGPAADFYKGGRLYRDGMPTDGDLYLQLYHTADTEELLEKIVPFRPAPLGSPLFFGMLFILGAGAFGWLLWELAAAPPAEQENG